MRSKQQIEASSASFSWDLDDKNSATQQGVKNAVLATEVTPATKPSKPTFSRKKTAFKAYCAMGLLSYSNQGCYRVNMHEI